MSCDESGGAQARRSVTLARCLGIVVQGLVLGTLLAIAIVQLVVLATGGRMFRYEGF